MLDCLPEVLIACIASFLNLNLEKCHSDHLQANQELQFFKPYVKKLTVFHDDYEQDYTCYLRLRTLRFGYGFRHPIDKLRLPLSLKVLEFGWKFNQPVEKLLILPDGLERLIFGVGFNQPVQELALPATLQHLEFDFAFNQSIENLDLPQKNALKSVVVGACFNQRGTLVKDLHCTLM